MAILDKSQEARKDRARDLEAQSEAAETTSLLSGVPPPSYTASQSFAQSSVSAPVTFQTPEPSTSHPIRSSRPIRGDGISRSASVHSTSSQFFPNSTDTWETNGPTWPVSGLPRLERGRTRTASQWSTSSALSTRERREKKKADRRARKRFLRALLWGVGAWVVVGIVVAWVGGEEWGWGWGGKKKHAGGVGDDPNTTSAPAPTNYPGHGGPNPNTPGKVGSGYASRADCRSFLEFVEATPENAGSSSPSYSNHLPDLKPSSPSTPSLPSKVPTFKTGKWVYDKVTGIWKWISSPPSHSPVDKNKKLPSIIPSLARFSIPIGQKDNLKLAVIGAGGEAKVQIGHGSATSREKKWSEKVLTWVTEKLGRSTGQAEMLNIQEEVDDFIQISISATSADDILSKIEVCELDLTSSISDFSFNGTAGGRDRGIALLVPAEVYSSPSLSISVLVPPQITHLEGLSFEGSLFDIHSELLYDNSKVPKLLIEHFDINVGKGDVWSEVFAGTVQLKSDMGNIKGDLIITEGGSLNVKTSKGNVDFEAAVVSKPSAYDTTSPELSNITSLELFSSAGVVSLHLSSLSFHQSSSILIETTTDAGNNNLRLPSSYVGTFSAVTELGNLDVKLPWPVRMGTRRKGEILKKPTWTGGMVEGRVWWDGQAEDLGKAVTRTKVGNVKIGFDG